MQIEEKFPIGSKWKHFSKDLVLEITGYSGDYVESDIIKGEHPYPNFGYDSQFAKELRPYVMPEDIKKSSPEAPFWVVTSESGNFGQSGIESFKEAEKVAKKVIKEGRAEKVYILQSYAVAIQKDIEIEYF